MVLECPALRPYLLGMTDIVQTLLDAALPHVPFDGWSAETFDAAVRDTAIDPVVARGVCPRGAMDLALATTSPCRRFPSCHLVLCAESWDSKQCRNQSGKERNEAQ